jgi:hypothetical protein
MVIIDNASRAAVTVMSTVARAILNSMDWLESVLRTNMHNGGIGTDLQTVLIMIVICAFLIGSLRLLKGRLRTSISLILVLFLAHTLERIAHGPLVG